MQTVKTFLKKVDEETWPEQLDSFLLGHNSTPLVATGVAPAEFNLGRRPQTVLDRLRPERAIVQKQIDRDKTAVEAVQKQPRVPCPEQAAVVRSFKDPRVRWEPAQVVKPLGPRRVLVRTEHRLTERHTDQIKLQPGPQIQEEMVPQVDPEPPDEHQRCADLWPEEVSEPLLDPGPVPSPSKRTSPVKIGPSRPCREKRAQEWHKDFVLT